MQSTPLELESSGVMVTWASSNIWSAGSEGDNEQARYREYGLTTSYGSTVVAIPATVTGTTAAAISAVLGNLPGATTFHMSLGMVLENLRHGIPRALGLRPASVRA